MLWSSPSLFIVATCLASLVSSHTVITYPGWRGDNLHTTGNVTDTNGLGAATNDSLPGGIAYPYGMQWIYPCEHNPSVRAINRVANRPQGGGMPMTQNRTKWPVGGGAVGIQPGWFMGHLSAFFYINLGEGTIPINYSLPMQPVFEITGPTNQLYNGSFCLPQVPLPANFNAVIGNNATIQVIETAQHGAALYSVSRLVLLERW